MNGIRKRWEMIITDTAIGMQLMEELTRRELKFEVVGIPDLRIGKVVSWAISVWMTKAEWIELRSELYPVYGDNTNFYTSNNIKNK